MQSLSILFQVSLLWVSLLFLGHLPNREEDDSYHYAAAGENALETNSSKFTNLCFYYTYRLGIFSKLSIKLWPCECMHHSLCL